MINISSLTTAAADFTAADLARLAVPLQADPTRFQAYFGDDVDEVTAEIDEVPEWADHTVVAVDGDELVGWLVAEVDDEVGQGRVWWWGPVIAPGLDWVDVGRRLVDAAIELLDGRFAEFEFAVDARHHDAAALAEHLGCQRGTGSVLLHLDVTTPSTVGEPPTDLEVGPVTDAAPGTVATLHDEVFPDTHMTGDQLVASADDDIVLVATADSELLGYVRAEVQPGGGGYVDFLGVSPARRSRGIGRALVTRAIEQLVELGVDEVSLTVREDNAAARALYSRLGFDGTRILVPFRLGFAP